MRLYFFRHATAVDAARTDEARELTKKGREEARIGGAALVKLSIQPSHVLFSPLVRARQTAQITCEAMKFSGEMKVCEKLQNGTTTATLLKALASFGDADSILLVGHNPSMPHHISSLIGLQTSEGIELSKGAIACVELDELRPGEGRLRWLLRQKQLRLVAR
jgi:phosphohistidine phosphatase